MIDDAPTVDELFPLPPGHGQQVNKGGRPPTYRDMWHRLMANTTVDEDAWNPCWLWTGGVRSGYPSLTVRENGRHRSILAHREVFLQLGIPLPPGIEVDHLCYQPLCIRPCHMEAVTRKVNLARRRY